MKREGRKSKNVIDLTTPKKAPSAKTGATLMSRRIASPDATSTRKPALNPRDSARLVEDRLVAKKKDKLPEKIEPKPKKKFKKYEKKESKMPRVKQVKSIHETAKELNKTMKKRRQAGLVDAPRTFSQTENGKKTTVTVGGNAMGPSTAKKKKKK